ncbi:MAG: type III-B CRISPR module-associated protein Cmr3, partial [Candidatus Omnitrophica bacterium]|nr:type III-B CRISPR module-associated protein Cmr3 [Candidatus Omnitrophota bacterium]
FKIIFLTPAYFKNGWWFNTNPIKIYGVEIKLITALINKSVIFSGWDLAENKPKPAKKFVPEGSVYYCELLDGSVDTLFEKLNFANLSEENSKFGYGLTIIGGV